MRTQGGTTYGSACAGKATPFHPAREHASTVPVLRGKWTDLSMAVPAEADTSHEAVSEGRLPVPCDAAGCQSGFGHGGHFSLQWRWRCCHRRSWRTMAPWLRRCASLLTPASKRRSPSRSPAAILAGVSLGGVLGVPLG